MAGFKALVTGLRRAEQQLERQLEGIRNAISLLEFGSGGGVPKVPTMRRGRKGRTKAGKRKTNWSPAQRKAVSDRMRAYWAKRKGAKSK